jgi:hypothetical protein
MDNLQKKNAKPNLSYTIIDNLIAKRDFSQDKNVPIDLFNQVMSYFEKRLNIIE